MRWSSQRLLQGLDQAFFLGKLAGGDGPSCGRYDAGGPAVSLHSDEEGWQAVDLVARLGVNLDGPASGRCRGDARVGHRPAEPAEVRLSRRFSDTHLRTLQRRVQQWRGIMAKKLVYAAVDEPVPELPAMPELALVGAGPQVLKFQ